MRILFWAAWYPTKYDAMPGLFVKYHAKAASLYANIAVIHIALVKEQTERLSISYTNDEIPTLILYYRPIQLPVVGKLLTFFTYFFLSIYAYRIMKRKWGTPQVNHLHVIELNTIFPLFLRFFSGIPYVVTEHFSGYLPQNWHKIASVTRKMLSKVIAGRATHITTVSPQLQDGMKAYGIQNKHWTIVPNVVDTDLFTYSTKKQEENVLQIINVSCFDDEPKNLSGLLKALNYLINELQVNAYLTLVGDGPDSSKIAALIKELSLIEHVNLTGLLEGDSLVKAYHHADVFVLFSRYETFGVVLIEAMSCGLPIIASNVGGIPYIVHQQNGVLVTSEDIQSLATTLAAFHKNAHPFNRDEIRKEAIEKYSYPVVGKQLFWIYQQALSKT